MKLLNKLQISEDQLNEWTESPVTRALKSLIQEQLNGIANTPISETLVYGEPQKSQDNLVVLKTMEVDYNDLIAYLEGDWDNLEGEEDDE